MLFSEDNEKYSYLWQLMAIFSSYMYIYCSRLDMRKKLPAYGMGKEYRVKIIDYERFLQQCRATDGDFQEED
jgi:hypothetical protein